MDLLGRRIGEGTKAEKGISYWSLFVLKDASKFRMFVSFNAAVGLLIPHFGNEQKKKKEGRNVPDHFRVRTYVFYLLGFCRICRWKCNRKWHSEGRRYFSLVSLHCFPMPLLFTRIPPLSPHHIHCNSNFSSSRRDETNKQKYISIRKFFAYIEKRQAFRILLLLSCLSFHQHVFQKMCLSSVTEIMMMIVLSCLSPSFSSSCSSEASSATFICERGKLFKERKTQR